MRTPSHTQFRNPTKHSQAYIPLAVGSVISFTALISKPSEGGGSEGIIDTSKIFDSLILTSLLTMPLIRLVQLIPVWVLAMASFASLRDFLAKPEILGGRESAMHRSRYGGDHSEIQLLSSAKTSGQTKWRHPRLFNGAPSISILHGNFGSGAELKLVDISLDINQGEHIVITGPPGCGKSLLLHAILGEVAPQTGTVRVEGVGIGYCGQILWSEPVATQESVFRFIDTDPQWQQTVLEACALGHLFNSPPSFDESVTRITKSERQGLV